MALSLHPGLKNSLNSFLETELPNLAVVDGAILTLDSLKRLLGGEAILPKHGPTRKELDRIFYEWPYFDFTSDYIHRTISETEPFRADDSPTPLCAIETFRDVPAAAARITDAFGQLPFTYTHTFSLPTALERIFIELGDRIDLSKEVRLLSGDAMRASGISLSNLDSSEPRTNWLPAIRKEWLGQRVYLQVENRRICRPLRQVKNNC